MVLTFRCKAVYKNCYAKGHEEVNITSTETFGIVF